MKVMNIEDIDTSLIAFDDPLTTYTGGRSVSIKYNGDKLRFFTPKVYLPFGVSEFKTETMEFPRLSLEMSLKGQSDQMTNFAKFIDDVDSKVLGHGSEHSDKWFSKQLSEDDIKAIYRKSLKKSEKFPPLLKTKMTTDSRGVYYGDVFDKFKNVTTVDSIKKGVYAQTIVECIGIYFAKKEFGLTWKVVQIKVFPQDRLRGYAFCDDDEETAEKI